MSSSILFIGLQEDESTLLREACSLEDYTVEEVSNVVMPPRDQVDPDLVILSTRTPQETLSDFASQDQLRSRMLLIVHEPDWEILQDVAPFGVIAARSSLDEIRYRLRDAFQRKGEQLIRRLGLLQQRDGSVWATGSPGNLDVTISGFKQMQCELQNVCDGMWRPAG